TPTPPSAGFDTTVSELTVDFSDTSTGNITSWSWAFGDGKTATEENPAHTYAADGTYTVSLTVSGTDGTDVETRVISVAKDAVCDSNNLGLCLQDADCASAGGYWYNGKCNATPQQAVCDADNLNLCNTESKCSPYGYWYNGKCNESPQQAVCDSDNLNLCNTESKCSPYGYWYNGTCNQSPQSSDLTCTGFDSCLEFSVGGVFFDIGDEFSLNLNVSVNQPNRFKRLDLYIAIQLPNGAFLFFTQNPFQPLSADFMPFKESLELLAAKYNVFGFEVSPGLKGSYTAYALMTDAGKPLDIFNLRSNLAMVEFTFR
ncbi:MAG: PKD domain-containing protein, partial [Desulfamplus sp.]|nr:PKD domain-containing protein [Desulfamplus sp.]